MSLNSEEMGESRGTLIFLNSKERKNPKMCSFLYKFLIAHESGFVLIETIFGD